MIKAVLFDLDGTLLPLKMEEFMTAYFHEVGRVFGDVMKPEDLIKTIMKATEYMVSNLEPAKTNKQAFEEELERLLGQDVSELMDRFMHFYANDFKNVKRITKAEPICSQVIDCLVSNGYDIILATNPLFPRIAIEERVKWAGIEKKHFKAITTFEEMHFCKPNIEYYREIMEMINMEPQHCLMVGNDVEEDMIARSIGMKTFLLDEYIICRSRDAFEVDYRGGYNDLLDFVSNNLTYMEKEEI